MHDYYTICKVKIQSSTNGSLHRSGYISGSNKHSNGLLIFCHNLSWIFSHHYIGIIWGALSQGIGGYEVTPIIWAQMKYWWVQVCITQSRILVIHYYVRGYQNEPEKI